MLDSTPTSPHSGETPLLQTVGLTKRYGNFLANDSIDIDIWPQQIHALLGENGAGKSTLVKTIYGLVQPSEGEMRWQGEKMVLSGPSEARARGIGMVFQHFSLFDNLTVAENVALGLDGKESFKDMSARLEEVSARLRASARSQARGLAAVGRRAPAHRDRPRADAESRNF